MRAVHVLAVAALAVVTGTAALSCSDLFHSTADVRTACEVDPTSLACGGPGADATKVADAGLDFCAWSSAEAKVHAMHACAWLGACETPMGRNAFGSCMFDALLAYDCASNPAHGVKGTAHDLWACLAMAESCAAVDQCVLPPGVPACAPGNYAGCVGEKTDTSGGAARSLVHVECTDSGAHGENCLLWAQECTTGGGAAACGAPPASACGQGGAPKSCISGGLRCAATGGDLALDCTVSGARTCDGFPKGPTIGWVACVPDDAGADAACAPTLATTCSDGSAASCASGVREAIDCATLLGSSSACASGMLSPPFDWTSPCAVIPPQCAADICDDDGGAAPDANLVGCVRGAVVPVNCAAQGLGPCRIVTTDVGTRERPACAPPQPASPE